MLDKKKETKQESQPQEPKKDDKELTLEEVKADNRELIELLQNLQAEFENYKKREEKSKEEFTKFCSSTIFLDLLTIMDSFESALQKINPAQKEIIEPLYYQLKSYLEKNNVKQFSAINETFNPELHEAVQQGFDPDKDENIVLEEIKKGYYLHNKVLRNAQVKINRKPTEKIEEIKKHLKQQLEEFEEDKTPEQLKQIEENKTLNENPSRTISASLNEAFTVKETQSAIIKETGLYIYWPIIENSGPSIVLQISWQNMKAEESDGINPRVTRITLKKGESAKIFKQKITALEIDAAKKMAKLVVKKITEQDNSKKQSESDF